MAELLQSDLEMFSRLGVSAELLERAGVERVTDAEARETFGIRGPGAMDGILFPYFDPLSGARRTARVRRDLPEMEGGKPKNKYMSAWGDRRCLYFPPNPVPLINDAGVSVVLVEGEKSVLGLAAWSQRNGRKLLAIATGGVWGWSGRVGKVETPSGHFADQKGPVPELRICSNREVIVAFDSNVQGRGDLRAARAALVRELLAMGARVRIATVPPMPAVNGPDDLYAAGGDQAIASMLELAAPAPEVALADAEAAIAAVATVRPNITTKVLRQAFDAIANVPDRLQVQVLAGRLAGVARGVVPKQVIIDELESRRLSQEQKQAAFVEEVHAVEDRRHPEDVAALLTDIENFFRRFFVMTEAHYTVLPVWVLHTHVFCCFDFTPILLVRSATKRCGKSNVLAGLKYLTWKSWGTGNTSTAALARKAEEGCTLLLDESDSAFKGPTEYKEALRGILNTRFARDGTYTRCVEKNGVIEVKDFSTFGPTAIAGIGAFLPDTVLDRSIPIVMRRKGPQEATERFRHALVQPVVQDLHRRIERWATCATDRLAEIKPVIIEELNDRAWDICEPLVAIAELVGGDWPARLRAALLEIYSADAAQDEDVGVQLLHDIKGIFDATDGDKITSSDLVGRLKEIETSPWADWSGGRGLSAHGLSRLLRNFDVHPRTVRTGSETSKGYTREAFADAFGRYLLPSPLSLGGEPSHPSQPSIHAGLDPVFDPSQKPDVTVEKGTSDPRNQRVVTDVTDETAPGRGVGGKESDSWEEFE